MHVKNIRLNIAYDGANYFGWQKTLVGPTIEVTIEKVLYQILQEHVFLQAASRTDAGVHANGQVVNFMLSKKGLSLEQLKMSMNCLLPKDIVVVDILQVDDNFHPTLNCISKEYHYSVCFGSIQLPCERFYAWHFPHQLDLHKMQQAAQYLVGLHDFSAFCNLKTYAQYDDYMRNVHAIDIFESKMHQIRFNIIGNNFLYKMVRNLVGTLVYVGCGRIALERIPEILLSKDRKQAGVTAPAHGLSLYKVNY